MSDVRIRFEQVFREVFEDDAVVVEEHRSAKDYADWDSLRHISLIIAMEKAFNVRFATSEIAGLREPDQNIGSFLALVERKLNGSPRSTP